MVMPRKGPAGIVAPPPAPPAVITAPPVEPAPTPEIGFDIAFDEAQFKEFIELEPSGETKKLDFGIIVPADFAKAVVAAARNNAGNDTPTPTQWITAALEKARKVKPAVEAGKLTADQGVCVLAVICFMAYAAARRRGDSIDAALKVAEGIVDELSKPAVAPPKVDPAARTVEAPRTPAPVLVAKAPDPPKKVEPAKASASAKPAPATTSGSTVSRRGTTPTEIIMKVGEAAAGGFGDATRPASDTKLAEAAKAAADAAKAKEAADAAKAKAAADAEAARLAKQEERQRQLKEAADRSLFDQAEANRKKAEAEDKAEVAKIEQDLRNKRAAKLRGERLRLIAAYSAACATVEGTERAQLEAEHKAALLELDAELANLGVKPVGNRRFTAVVFTVIGVVIVLGLILGAFKLAEGVHASSQPTPTATTPTVATATATPGVETCVPVTASLLNYYLGNEDPARYVDKGNAHSRNAARLACSTAPTSVGVNTYDVTACQVCYTP